MGLAYPTKSRGLTGMDTGLAHYKAKGCNFGPVWNPTDLFLQSEAAPLAGYPDPLVTLPKDGLAKAAYLGKTRFQEIHHFFHVSPYNSPTQTPEGLPSWHSKVNIELKQLGFFSQQY